MRLYRGDATSQIFEYIELNVYFEHIFNIILEF